MRRKRFGTHGTLVPVIGQGTWPLPDRDALRFGISLGMTHIDTAEMYGDGRSEEIVGEAIVGVPRDQLFLVSKVLPQHATASGVRKACERSLRRTGTDYFDCYLLHWRGNVPIDETMRGLEDLVEAGMARSIGVSNLDPWDLREAAAGLRKQRIACDQVLYNLRERTIEDHELPWAREAGSCIVAYTPLGGMPGSPSGKGARVLDEIARERGVGAHAVTLAFLTHDPLVFAIPKASRREHVSDNATAGDLQLTAQEVAAIDQAFPKHKRTGPLPTN
jgi:diketogulonate reductase-like aldo/keto reductase